MVSRFVDLTDVPVVDGHGHPLLPDPWSVSAETFVDLFSEGRPGTMAAHVPHTVYFRRACRDLARWLDSGVTVDAILEARRKSGAAGARRLLAERRVAALLMDTGYPPGAMALADMQRTLPSAVHEVFRIETCAERLVAQVPDHDAFMEAFRAALRDAARTCVAFKSIVAYRSGLAVRPPDTRDARRSYDDVATRVRAGGSRRLTEKPLLDALFFETLEAARETGRPVQVHAGFGDPDIDLLASDPLLLRPVLEDARWAGVRLVLLHMAYPYAREAAFMTAVWPQVYLDLSLAIPFLGPGVAPALVDVLSLAPSSKLLYGSDVSALPELFALSADWGRVALGEALGWLIERDALTGSEARAVGRQILCENAAALYGVEVGELPRATGSAPA
jgi:predicted TIM-barrel fold metal-dependent hydrolase